MKRKNKSTLLVCINCMIITLAILLLPLAFFETSIYVKRSANTFVGDEKYVEARAEAETVAAQHEGAVIEESVTERVNSKGVTTSMVTFTVKETVRRNGLDFLLHGVGHSEGMSGVGPANVMRLLLGSMAVSLVLLLCASYKTLELPRTDLPKTANRLYTAAGVFVLIAWFCVPAFVRAMNYTFARQVDLLVGGHIQNDALLAQLNAFLYGGQAGDGLMEMLRGLTVKTNWAIWVAFAALFLLLCAITCLRCGELKKTLARGGLYLFVIALCIFILYPFYVMLITGFRSNAETTDMYVHSSDISRILISPNDIQKVLTAVNFVRVEHQKFQHVKLFCGKIDLLACNKYTTALAVQFQISGLDRLCFFFFFLFGTCTTHDCLNTCLDFQNIERFCDIVICTVIQSQNLIHIFTFCSQHNDRNIGKFPDLLAYLQSVHLRKHQIQKDDVIFICLCFLDCFLAVVCTVNLHAILLQIETDSFYDQFLVIHH